MVVRELVALLGIQTNQPSFNKAFSNMGQLTKAAGAVGLALLAIKAIDWARDIYQEIAKIADEFDDMSQRIGVSAESLQRLDYVAKLTGTDLGAMEAGLRNLGRAQVEAGKAGSEQAKAFKSLGVDIKDSSGNLKKTDQLLAEMGDGFKNLKSDQERTVMAMKLFGKAGTALVPMLKGGTAELQAMLNEADALGVVMDEQLIKAGAEYSDNLEKMSLATRGIKASIAKGFLPVINKLYKAFFDWWKINQKWISQKIGFVFKGIGQVAGNTLLAIGKIVKVFVDWIKNLSPLEKGILKIGTAITIIGALIMAGPIGKLLLLASIIALIIDDFMVWRKGGKSVIGDLINYFNRLLGIDLVVWIQNAWTKISWVLAGLKNYASALIESYLALADFLISVWTEPEAAIRRFLIVMGEIWADWAAGSATVQAAIALLTSAWQGLCTFFSTAWANFVSAWDYTLEYAVNRWTNRWLGLKDWVVQILTDLGSWVVGWATDLVSKVSEPFKKIGGWVADLFSSNPEIEAKVKTASPKLEGIQALVKPPGGIGPGAALAAQPRGGMSQTIAPTANVQIDVKAAPGMNEAALASEVSKAVSNAMDRQNRALIRSLTPAPQPAGI